jgi:hypothetical protein
MDATQAVRLTQWLKASRGTQTQEDLAADITAKTGWRITRDRYSRYESGSLAIGQQTLEHFVDYWATRNVEGPDLSAPVPVTEVEFDLAAAVLAQSRILQAQVDAIDRNTAVMSAILQALARQHLTPEDRQWMDGAIERARQGIVPTSDLGRVPA